MQHDLAAPTRRAQDTWHHCAHQAHSGHVASRGGKSDLSNKPIFPQPLCQQTTQLRTRSSHASGAFLLPQSRKAWMHSRVRPLYVTKQFNGLDVLKKCVSFASFTSHQSIRRKFVSFNGITCHKFLLFTGKHSSPHRCLGRRQYTAMCNLSSSWAACLMH